MVFAKERLLSLDKELLKKEEQRGENAYRFEYDF